MAIVVYDNPVAKTRGQKFELDLLHKVLKPNLPDAYYLGHHLEVPGSEGATGRDFDNHRTFECDILVAGPNGLFLIEAKLYGHLQIDGEVWRFVDTGRERIIGRKQHDTLVDKVRRIGRLLGTRFSHAALYPRGLFVFPSGSSIEARPTKHSAWSVSDTSPFHQMGAITYCLQDCLPQLIREAAPPQRMPPISKDRALDFVREVKGRRPSGCQVAESATIGSYQIRHGTAEDWRDGAEGVRYRRCVLKHIALGHERLGTHYDTSALDEASDRELLEKQIRRNLEVLAKVRQHPNILRILDVEDDPYRGFLVVTDHVSATPLDQLLGSESRIGPRRAWTTLLGVAEGLLKLHHRGFIYRCLTPESILIRKDNGQAVLRDFELTKTSAEKPRPTVAVDRMWEGDNPYIANEVRADAHIANEKSDVFSVAAIALHLLTGSPPATDLKVEEAPRLFVPHVRSGPHAELLARCLDSIPRRRPSLKAVRDLARQLSRKK